MPWSPTTRGCPAKKPKLRRRKNLRKDGGRAEAIARRFLARTEDEPGALFVSLLRRSDEARRLGPGPGAFDLKIETTFSDGGPRQFTTKPGQSALHSEIQISPRGARHFFHGLSRSPRADTSGGTRCREGWGRGERERPRSRSCARVSLAKFKFTISLSPAAACLRGRSSSFRGEARLIFSRKRGRLVAHRKLTTSSPFLEFLQVRSGFLCNKSLDD